MTHEEKSQLREFKVTQQYHASGNKHCKFPSFPQTYLPRDELARPSKLYIIMASATS